jgi:DNA-binding beta-propeller fold protein YncE
MYVVQSSPGALLRVNTSVGPDGDVRREPTGSVEVCPRPAEMALYEDGANSFALVSCYSVGQVYIVDLNGFQVVSVTQVGTGPHRMTVDLAREAVFVGNTLDATISVIDMGDGRPTRFTEIGRLGLQEPYSG